MQFEEAAWLKMTSDAETAIARRARRLLGGKDCGPRGDPLQEAWLETPTAMVAEEDTQESPLAAADGVDFEGHQTARSILGENDETPTPTTLAIQNIPQRYTQAKLAREWDQEPWDFLILRGHVAFLNFESHEAMLVFREQMHGRCLNEGRQTRNNKLHARASERGMGPTEEGWTWPHALGGWVNCTQPPRLPRRSSRGSERLCSSSLTVDAEPDPESLFFNDSQSA